VNAGTLAAAPRLVYNHKDDMQDAFVEQVTGRQIDAPHHYVPSTPAYVQIACRGLGWGMIPQHLAAPHIAAGALVELRPGAHCDVKLYFHRWQVQSRALGFLTACVHTAARKHLAFLAEEAGAGAGRRS
jgi:LysR family transcriptional regulator (chromosome initiation inhibitor)